MERRRGVGRRARIGDTSTTLTSENCWLLKCVRWERIACVCVGHVRDAPSQLAPMQAAWRAAHDMGVRAPPTVVDLPEETEAANVNSAFARALRPRNLELEVGPPMMFARSVSCLRDAAAAAAAR